MKKHPLLEWTNEPTIAAYIPIYYFFSQLHENIKKRATLTSHPILCYDKNLYYVIYQI